MVLPRGFEAPKVGGRYFKPDDGDNRVRIIGDAIMGYETWVAGDDGKRKPVRQAEPFTDDQLEEMGAQPDDYGNMQKMFVALPVIDRADDEKTKVWEVTQGMVMGSLQSLETSDDWGDLTTYDIIVSKTGAKKKTRYGVLPCPKKPLTQDERRMIEENPINLEALFEGGSPFGDDNGQPAKQPQSRSQPVQRRPWSYAVCLERSVELNKVLNDGLQPKDRVVSVAKRLYPGLPSNQFTEENWQMVYNGLGQLQAVAVGADDDCPF